jgi:hypothetical protein
MVSFDEAFNGVYCGVLGWVWKRQIAFILPFSGD